MLSKVWERPVYYELYKVAAVMLRSRAYVLLEALAGLCHETG